MTTVEIAGESFETTPQDLVNEPEKLPVRLTRGCLVTALFLAAVPMILVLLPLLLPSLNYLLGQIGLQLPFEPTYPSNPAYRIFEPIGWLGTALIGIYLVSLSADLMARPWIERRRAAVVAKRRPFSFLLLGIWAIVGTTLSFMGVLSQAVNELGSGLIKSTEFFFNFIEHLCETSFVRSILGLIFIGLSLTWILLTFFFISVYMTGEWQTSVSILGIIGSAGMAFISEVGAVGTWRRTSFRKLALTQFKLIGQAGTFLLVFGILFYFLFAGFNRFLLVGPLTFALIMLVSVLFLFELGRRSS